MSKTARLRAWLLRGTEAALTFIGRLFEEYKLARRALLIWALVMITISINRFWAQIASFPDPGKVVIVIIGLLSIVIGFYQWSRGNDK